jgi:hypothetical protein
MGNGVVEMWKRILGCFSGFSIADLAVPIFPIRASSIKQ